MQKLVRILIIYQKENVWRSSKQHSLINNKWVCKAINTIFSIVNLLMFIIQNFPRFLTFSNNFRCLHFIFHVFIRKCLASYLVLPCVNLKSQLINGLLLTADIVTQISPSSLFSLLFFSLSLSCFSLSHSPVLSLSPHIHGIYMYVLLGSYMLLQVVYVLYCYFHYFLWFFIDSSFFMCRISTVCERLYLSPISYSL